MSTDLSSVNPLLQPLYNILLQAEELVRLSQGEDWELFEAEIAKYQQQVTILNDQNYLKALEIEKLTNEAKEIIAKIQVLNDNLDTHANEMREKIASELRQMIQSNKAIDAYGR